METLATDAALNSIIERLKVAENFEDSMWELESEILETLGAERFTIYQKDASTDEIVSWYRTSNDSVEEIRLPINAASLAGKVASSLEPLIIDDAYDSDYLESIDPDLRFDHTYDQSSGYLTEAMVVVPIVFKDRLYGIFQLVNNSMGGPFTDEVYYKSLALVDVISENFRYELKMEVGPFDGLIQTGDVTIDQLEESEQVSNAEGISLSSVLRNKFEVKSEVLGEALSNYYQVPFHAYDENYIIMDDLLENLNKKVLASNKWVPLYNDGEKAIILISDPNDHDLTMEIQAIVKAMYYEWNVGLEEDILHYLGLDEYGKEIKQIGEVNLDDIDDMDVEAIMDDEDDGDLLDPEGSKIVQLVNKIIIKAVQDGVSDIHIEPMKGNTPGAVRMRVDGVCRKVFDIPSSLMRSVVSRIKILSNLDIAERRKPQDGKMTVKLGGTPLELRVATLPTVSGESTVMRILAQGDALPYDKLALSERNYKLTKELIAIPYGLFLVVGPTGSGKTTTLHAVLALLNNEERKILTAEDPVEITQDGLQQVQMLPRAGLTFAAAIRSFLRCDPDVILIGEMRDEETAGTGIEASLTGHMVFSTLHTNSAPETIIRLLDMGLDPMNFADALVGVLAQRLMRTLCKDCKESYKATEDDIERLTHYYGAEYIDELGVNWDEHELYRPTGCEKCGQSGYRGRVGIHELMEATPKLKQLVAKAAEVPELKAQALEDGMRTLIQDGVAKIINGLTDISQLKRVAN